MSNALRTQQMMPLKNASHAMNCQEVTNDGGGWFMLSSPSFPAAVFHLEASYYGGTRHSATESDTAILTLV